MIFETFLHKNEAGQFFLRLKTTGGLMKVPPKGDLRDEMWFGPFETEEEAERVSAILAEAVHDPKYHDPPGESPVVEKKKGFVN